MGREARGRRALGRAVGGARTPWSEATRPAPARTREREWHRVLPSHCLRRRVTSDVRASKDFVPCLGSRKGRLGPGRYTTPHGLYRQARGFEPVSVGVRLAAHARRHGGRGSGLAHPLQAHGLGLAALLLFSELVFHGEIYLAAVS